MSNAPQDFQYVCFKRNKNDKCCQSMDILDRSMSKAAPKAFY